MRTGYNLILLIVFVLQNPVVFGQTNDINVAGNETNFLPFVQTYHDSAGDTRFKNVIGKHYYPVLLGTKVSDKKFRRHTKIKEGVWMYLEARNTSETSVTRYFYFGTYLYSRAYVYNINENKVVFYNLKDTFEANKSFIFPVKFAAQNNYRIWFYLGGHNLPHIKYFHLLSAFSPKEISNKLINLDSGEQFWFIYVSLFVFIGVVFSMMMFSFVNMIQKQNSVYVFYFLYLLTTLLYFIFRNIHMFSTDLTIFYLEPIEDNTLQPLSYFFYYLFAVSFVEYKHLAPQLYKFMKWLMVGIAIYLIIDILFYLSYYYEYRKVMYMYFRFIMAPISLITIIWALTVNNKLSKILAFGSLLMVSGAILTMLLALLYYPSENPFLNYHMIYMQIGIVLEITLFSIGLSYKNKLQLREKILLELELKKERETKEMERLQTIINTQENERRRVSAELHDDLGSGISTIRLLSEVAKTKQQNQLELQKISHLANDLVDNMRQIIWSMNTENSLLSDLVHYIKSYAVDYLDLYHIKFTYSQKCDLQNKNLSGSERRNIFLTVKECLHNVVKHAEASEVIMEWNCSDTHQIITVIDNGKGIHVSENNNQGNGVRNMQKRMNQLGGEVIINSSPEKETKVTISFN